VAVDAGQVQQGANKSVDVITPSSGASLVLASIDEQPHVGSLSASGNNVVITIPSGAALGNYSGQYCLRSNVAGSRLVDFGRVDFQVVAGGTQPARAPFQIMALRDRNISGFGTPGSNHTIGGVLSSPMNGTAPHIMSRSVINYMVDAIFVGQGFSDPPTPAQAPTMAARLNDQFGLTTASKEIAFLNNENAFQSWLDVAGFDNNAAVSAAVPKCVGWVEAVRSAAPNCLIAWYSMPSNVRRARSLTLLQNITPLQDDLCNALDILAPEVYMRRQDVESVSSFNSTFNLFRSKIQYVRDRYPDKLLCPTVWEQGLVVGGWHSRSEGQSCPVSTSGNNQFATYETYLATGEAWCTLAAMTRTQFDDILGMLFDEGCDGVFYWSREESWGSYWTDANYPGIRDFHAFATGLNGAVPIGDHTATFLQNKGPFAP